MCFIPRSQRYPRSKVITEQKVRRLLTISGNTSFMQYSMAKRVGKPVQQYLPVGVVHRARFTAQMVKLHAITFIQQIRFQMKENSNRTLTIFRKDAESHQKDGEEKEKQEEKEEEKEKEKEKEEEKAAGAGNAVTATTHQAKSAPDTPR
mmetsp:Transcript_32147/g.54481  ORF Transcript_32147/g.54481 Transcript_32147/m.54481 type:complete len:149 (+) Transcript_32147:486-932(+)